MKMLWVLTGLAVFLLLSVAPVYAINFKDLFCMSQTQTNEDDMIKEPVLVKYSLLRPFLSPPITYTLKVGWCS